LKSQTNGCFTRDSAQADPKVFDLFSIARDHA
jgi:hypothetical protein